MDGVVLRDEAVQDRVRAATEFLDPSMFLETGSCYCEADTLP